MTALENEIIEAVRNIPFAGYGEYKLMNDLYRTIARVMGYQITTTYYRWNFRNYEDHEKVRKIIAGMEKKGIIKKSKSGQAFMMIAK
jgi:hypothetical protein